MGRRASQTKTPLDLEESISLPRGNIFHRELSFPFREDESAPGWGVETRRFTGIYLWGWRDTWRGSERDTRS
jgi:hypothetical protein